MYAKNEFSVDFNKDCGVAFRLVFQFPANLLFNRKSTKIHSHRLLVFASTAILFRSCILVRIIYLIDKISLHCIYWLIITGLWYWWFLPSKVSVSKYTEKWKYYWRKNQGPIGMNHCALSAAQDICSNLQNQAKCDLAAFTTIPLKFNFSYTFWLLKVAIIARTNYNC